MSEYTPGPWIFECEDVGTYGSNFWLESEAGEEIICESENEYQGVLIKGNDFVANARLLAAAPDLLAELEYKYEQGKCGCGHPACDRCKDDLYTSSVIKRAKGETE